MRLPWRGRPNSTLNVEAEQAADRGKKKRQGFSNRAFFLVKCQSRVLEESCTKRPDPSAGEAGLEGDLVPCIAIFGQLNFEARLRELPASAIACRPNLR
jgi:hypothetical protein